MRLGQIIPGLLEDAPIDFAKIDLKERFDRYNAELFDGELPTPGLSFSKMRQASGMTVGNYKLPRGMSVAEGKRLYRVSPSAFGVAMMEHGQVFDLKIKMCDQLIYEEELFEGFFIHEMVHLWFMSQGWIFEAHGREFDAKCREIEALAGFPIPLTHQLSGSEHIVTKPRRLGVMTFNGDKFLLFHPNQIEGFSDLAQMLSSRLKKAAVIYLTDTNVHAKIPIKRKPPRRVSMYTMDKFGDALNLDTAEVIAAFDQDGNPAINRR